MSRILITTLLLCSMTVLADTVNTADGGTYNGPLVDGRFEGEGVLSYPGGRRFEGHFHLGMLSGQGHLILEDGSEYHGEFAHGMPNGQGTWHYKNGTVYSGTLDNGWWVKGQLDSPGGEHYEGEFDQNRYHGYGYLKYADGTIYEGYFNHGLRHGQGKLIPPHKWVYEGVFKQNDLPYGTLTGPDGEHYEGGLVKWRYNGQGTYQDGNESYQGEFEDGLYHGQGTLTTKRSRQSDLVQTGQFEYGEFVSETEDEKDYLSEYEQLPEQLDFIINHQSQLLQQQLSALAPQTPGVVDTYVILAAPYSSQTVFRDEIDIIYDRLSSTRGLQNHIVRMSNEIDLNSPYPLVSQLALKDMVTAVSQHMGAEDLLWVYITSHGSRDHKLSVNLSYQRLPDIDSITLRDILDEADQAKIVTLSACYSGGFIDDLKQPDTLIITAAAADKTSFGCSNDNYMTYFGEAFFIDAFDMQHSLTDIFEKAKQVVDNREQQQELNSSDPQISLSETVLNTYEQWRARFRD
ncbi:C13 family peptidase [Gynuella sunshinyii]|uniref:Caspase family p20 domain-containing protein n=1 Tax=Gynuella sunshinyii YC6258 TaxID=1445510 RepID=A0A0C5VSL5_9GAMM|nr:C13 family peptidase [Gynuella sunshinyii]AJQ93254.1 hypothetical protein YC6258_01206 [Gynuella sunshinyii YC6258]